MIAKENEFHSKSCYELYLYAVSLAKQVNEYIDKGYIVTEDNYPFNKFVFYDTHSNKPIIAEKKNEALYVWYGTATDYNGKVWLHGEITKKSIKKDFKKIVIIEPKHKIKLNY